MEILCGILNKLSLRKKLIWQVLCLSLVLLSIDNDCVEGKKNRKKIKRRQPDDWFLPAMIVFNLDNILWPSTLEIMQPPLNAAREKHQIKDRVGRVFSLFPEVPDILEDLDSNWYKLGGLSDNADIHRIETVTDLFDIDKFFNAFESKPGNKTVQMQRLSERAKVPLENILYYDTNQLDLDDIKSMNVTTVLLHPEGGLTYTHLEQGFRVFRENKENATVSTTAHP